MQSFDSDGVEIAYLDEGDGDPVLLIHGFASNATVNWVDTGWVRLLVGQGRRAIAMDNRGHGRSQKLYRPTDYGAALMAEDARRLLDRLSIPRADVIGYSMGVRIAAFLALAYPARVRSAIFGGLGVNIVLPMTGTEAIAAALEAGRADQVADPVARTFRLFADQTGADRLALAACIRAARDPVGPELLARLGCPVLVAVGSNDAVGGSAAGLAALIPGARSLEITGRDHMKSVGDRIFKDGALAFLDERG